ncbi:YgdI/YgdR family lipoprotein [Bordetella genomosp. 1]|uniref:YgdI/YgdR family lipoprotein n=1 Tax=Bordetella genomosp. 1 TaxID=1395607 RepID=A0A261S7R9_9BORD|nr:YgdI/YgdR family lipoprotein [Bordetella genomosp. 1]MDQ8033067.1 YgdI/YgdR family lipoprotein [Bordetella sp.]OZI32830.1 YgdI/YgdR family lipoprotein [Bordetella genomosp. 1]OZI65820.1 YgdI/YgdR family lipoprotein [Bordetella genomosp. 1]
MTFKTMTLAFVLTSVGVLAGCSSPTVVEKRDGSQVMTSDEPEYNKKTGFYEYEKDGKKVQMNKDDVKTMEQIK